MKTTMYRGSIYSGCVLIYLASKHCFFEITKGLKKCAIHASNITLPC